MMRWCPDTPAFWIVLWGRASRLPISLEAVWIACPRGRGTRRCVGGIPRFPASLSPGLLVRRRPPSEPEQMHRNALPRGLPGVAIVRSAPRCRMVGPGTIARPARPGGGDMPAFSGVAPAAPVGRHIPAGSGAVPSCPVGGHHRLEDSGVIPPACHLERVSPRTSRKVTCAEAAPATAADAATVPAPATGSGSATDSDADTGTGLVGVVDEVEALDLDKHVEQAEDPLLVALTLDQLGDGGSFVFDGADDSELAS